MKVQIKRLHPDAVIPKYATAYSSGFDLVAVEKITIQPGETTLVKTGFSIQVPAGFELQVRPRSGLSLKTQLRVANAPGTVDADYRGEVGVIMTNEVRTFDNKSITIEKGDRIAQGVIAPVERVIFEVVDALDETERGSGGFGSTGSK